MLARGQSLLLAGRQPFGSKVYLFFRCFLYYLSLSLFQSFNLSFFLFSSSERWIKCTDGCVSYCWAIFCRLWFKAGNGDEPVVLCDDTTTFEVKTIDISNTMLLVEPSPGNSAMELTGSPRTVAGQVRSYLELVPIAPHTAKLKNMLAQCYFDGAAAEVADDGEEAVPLGLSTEELVDQVQASRTEILTALHSMHAIELDGRWRLLAPRYALETFRLIINTAIAQDWPLASLKSSQLREYLEDEHGIPVFVIETLLRQYGQAVDADCVALDEEAVLRFAAKEVFVEGDKVHIADVDSASCIQSD